jgi:uncharacterized protein (TIGR00251 family)
MIVNVRVIPGASRDLVKDEAGKLKVYVTKPAQDGRANARVIELLAKHFGIKKYEISIIKGEKARDKAVQIPDVAKR